MEFRDLKSQYKKLKNEIDRNIEDVITNTHFIGGDMVKTLEKELAEYVGAKHCITCGNGTDALMLVLKAWGIKEGDYVLVPDFTFFASAEVIALLGATPVFVDVDDTTFNIDPEKLEKTIKDSLAKGLNLKAVVVVDLFGLPAEYEKIEAICKKYGLKLLEDAAQGFSGSINSRKNCSFGDAGSTSFFPAKPLGCYGDGGAIFVNDDETAKLIRSYAVHGKGEDKYDNIRIGVNSRLDSIQAAVLLPKLHELETEQESTEKMAALYTELLKDSVKTPVIPDGYRSAWAQYTVKYESSEERDFVAAKLKENSIPAMIYYKKPMHVQGAFKNVESNPDELKVSTHLCDVVMSLPLSPYITEADVERVAKTIIGAVNEFRRDK